jgi:hypothetical protein
MWKCKKERSGITLITPPKSINYDNTESFKELISGLLAKGDVQHRYRYETSYLHRLK